MDDRGWWIAVNAVAVPIASRSSACPDSGPSLSTTSLSERPSMYSLAMYGVLPSRSASTTRALQNEATRSAALSSLAKRDLAIVSPLNFTCSSLIAARSPWLLVPRLDDPLTALPRCARTA
ncbi:hypothetical protein GCM10020219_036780 [Nonomuraea dietziae]